MIDVIDLVLSLLPGTGFRSTGFVPKTGYITIVREGIDLSELDYPSQADYNIKVTDGNIDIIRPYFTTGPWIRINLAHQDSIEEFRRFLKRLSSLAPLVGDSPPFFGSSSDPLEFIPKEFYNWRDFHDSTFSACPGNLP